MPNRKTTAAVALAAVVVVAIHLRRDRRLCRELRRERVGHRLTSGRLYRDLRHLRSRAAGTAGDGLTCSRIDLEGGPR